MAAALVTLATVSPPLAAPGPTLTVAEIPSPAAPESGEPNLAAANGRVYLTWIEPGTKQRFALRYATRGGGKWSAAKTIAEGTDWFVNWADFPSMIVLPDGSMTAHWLAKSGPGTYAYNVTMARSTNSGASWGKPFTPHRDGTETEHGFVSMAPLANNQIGAVWLDGRQMASHAGHEGGGEMSLMYTTIDAGGALGPEVRLDGRVCECCQTSAAVTNNGIVVVYRDRSEKEVRDISIVRIKDGKATAPQPLSKDGWEINACPVNGPSITAAGSNVAVTWFTAVNDKPQAKVAFSKDAGATFGSPIPIDDGNPIGRVDVLLLGGGDALVSWVERTAQGAQIRMRRVNPNGTRGPALTVAESSAARASGFPRMEKLGNEIVIAWTDANKPARVRTAVVNLGNSTN